MKKTSKLSIMKAGVYVSLVVVVVIAALIPLDSSCEQNQVSVSSSDTDKRTSLARAVMCEEIYGQVPQGEAVVFSVKLGTVLCFSLFDPVPQQTSISHKWFFRDKINAEVRLSLKPPRWATFSRIQLRNTDKGPWRVEVVDEGGRVLHVLRFSIVD
ncbi:MAG: DUF2914 domain-containing protein [Thermodesulfobacteriota bacterium]|nr:DUF2914 domain-containing protein [Thermodesulfobacteriota bacterium]